MYKRTNGGCVIDLSDGKVIPIDPANSDYQAFLSWESAGNEPLPVSAPTKAERIAALTTEYKADIQQMQSNWLAASVAGGATEATKKATIVQDIADRKIQYTNDVNAVRNS